MFSNITVLGNLGQDSEIKENGNGPFLTFSLAVNSGKDEPPVWYNITTGANVELYQDMLKKGTTCLVSGQFLPREYERKDGTKGVSYDIRRPVIRALNK